MSVLEKTTEDRVCKWAVEHGFLTPKVKFVEVGWPDRLFISPKGRHIYIEFKRKGEEPRPIQYHRIKNLSKRGVMAVWTDSYDYAVGVLQAVLDTEALSDKSDKTLTVASVGGSFLRPRIGEDVYRTGGYQDPYLERFSSQNPYSRAPTGGDDGVAGGDTEVG